MCYLLIPTSYSACVRCLCFLCWFPYMSETVIVLLSLSKMRGIYCIPLCQLTVVVARIPNLSRVHVSSSLIRASSWCTVCEYRLSSLHVASLLSLFHPFFYPLLLPSPALFPLYKAMRSCRRKGCQSSVLRSWSQVSNDRWDAALSKFPFAQISVCTVTVPQAVTYAWKRYSVLEAE